MTKVDLNPALDTRITRFSFPEDRASLSDPQHQMKMREAYERPGIILIDNALDQDLIDRLRVGLSEKVRKFKDPFNEGVEKTGPLADARAEASAEIARITDELFGYDLPTKSDKSYRPMISADEPIHFDTYYAECGVTPLMSTLNFAPDERVWHVGPHFAEMCSLKPTEVEDILRGLKPGTSPSHPLRVAGIKGHGPLADPNNVHKIHFAPNALWYANPKILSHKLVYGRGALLGTWMMTDAKCRCQKCLLDEAGIKIEFAADVNA